MSSWQPKFSPDVDLQQLNMVLSPGRVGTTSIFKWLNLSGVKTFKSHMSNRQMVSWEISRLEEQGKTPPPWLRESFHILGRAMQEADPVRIVLPLREPFARNLSAFRRFLSSGRTPIPQKPDARKLAALFEETVPADRLDTWLERNLFPLLPPEDLAGHVSDAKPSATIGKGRLRFLLLRIEPSDVQDDPSNPRREPSHWS